MPPRKVSRFANEAFHYPIPLCWPTEDHRCACGGDHADGAVGKAPLVRIAPYTSHLPTRGEVHRWLHRWPHANRGLMLEPTRLVVVDIDSGDAIREAEALGLPAGPTVLTAK